MPKHASETLKVRLDHIIPRESLRWVETQPVAPTFKLQTPIKVFKYISLADSDGYNSLFPLLRKPDFQRETSAWTPYDCQSLLQSVIQGLIIPSVIIWKSPDNNYVYVLDGAHRISVVRAWMTDDWGDKAPQDYYERHEYEDEILDAAEETRYLINSTIGSYQNYVRSGQRYLEYAKRQKSPAELGEPDASRGLFYTELMMQETGFQVQEVPGDYERAESSFLKINRSGQPLNDWETTLIENRNSSFARSVLSIANGGTGRFWPETVSEKGTSNTQLDFITQSCTVLHRKMFVPPFEAPIKDANVPFIASTQYFPKHLYLLELIPIIMGKNDLSELFEVDRDATSPKKILENGYNLVAKTVTVFRHLIGDSNDPLSLSIVPLFYFYTQAGRYVRSSLYGFITWLMAGSEDDIRTRKLAFSVHRERFERVIFENDIAGALTRRIGSGLRAVEGTVEFYQSLVALLLDYPDDINSKDFKEGLDTILKKLTVLSKSKDANQGRTFTTKQKSTINIRQLFNSSIRCEICGGILNLNSGVQYDHITRYMDNPHTSDDEGRPTHPFCNNQRDAIEALQKGINRLVLPQQKHVKAVEPTYAQMSLFSQIDFPDEP